jgi:hypothetical protein
VETLAWRSFNGSEDLNRHLSSSTGRLVRTQFESGVMGVWLICRPFNGLIVGLFGACSAASIFDDFL